MTSHRIPCLFAALALLAATPPDAPARAPLNAFVSIPPQGYFVGAIGGDHVRVRVLLQPGQSPHTFEPPPKQIAQLADADVYFRGGMPFEEAFVRKLASANPRLAIVDTREGIDLLPMDEASHDADHDHGEGQPDPHYWLDPTRALVQAETVARTLSRLDPEHAASYRENLESLRAEVERLAGSIAANLAPLKGREFFVYHPAYGYFGQAFGLRQVAVETGGKEPSARQLAALIDRARAEEVRVIFVQPQFSSKSAQTVADAIGGAVIALDPLAEDYLGMLATMASRLAEAIGPRR